MAKNVATNWKIGHRVTSNTEPELGLGEVEAIIEARVVQVRFDLVQQKRRYIARGDHLRRVELKPGDRVTLRDGSIGTISTLALAEDFLIFDTLEGPTRSERDLHPRQHFTGAIDNFLRGRWSNPKHYPLLRETLAQRPFGEGLKAALLASARIDLLEHQLHVAWQATDNFPIRLLLSDEVGLGKTIESGLIASLLIGLGRSKRIVVACPDALQNQWLAELYRRFNVFISLFPDLSEEDDPLKEAKQFLNTSRNVIVPWRHIPTLLAAIDPEHPPFDLIIIDEAHQLLSEEFLASEPTGQRAIEWIVSTPNCLFLTATPKFLGNATEFRLLNLLNDGEFPDYETYLAKLEKLKRVDEALSELTRAPDGPRASARALLAGYAHAERLLALPAPELGSLLAEVWGYGDTVVRNRREKLHFDIKRRLVTVTIPESKPARAKAAGDAEPSAVMAATGNATDAAKVTWLSELLRERPNEKFLVIASKADAAVSVHRQLTERENLRAGLFHEGMDLLQRDRVAEWFHQPSGAQVLVCSEIGGEGRNFQHADGLVLLDLPLEPNLLEQRIGRLDRIGRRHDVEVLVPVAADSPQALLLRWYDEAVEIFTQPWNGELDLTPLLAERLPSLVAAKTAAARAKVFEALVSETRLAVRDHRRASGEALEHLLDMQSFNPTNAKRVRKLCEQASDPIFLEYLERAFDAFDIDMNFLDDEDTFNISASSLSFAEDLAEFVKVEDRVLTIDRGQALGRENLTFISPAHPIARSLSDNILIKNQGYATVATANVGKEPLVLQAVCSLQVPPHRGWDLSAYFARPSFEIAVAPDGGAWNGRTLDEGSVKKPNFQLSPALLQTLSARCEPLIKALEAQIAERAKREIADALEKARAHWENEAEKLRLKHFASNLEDYREEMIEKRFAEIRTAIGQTDARIEALRLLINPKVG